MKAAQNMATVEKKEVLYMTTLTAKQETGQKCFMNMNKAEIEAYFAIATEQAQKELHDRGHPYVVGTVNESGMYTIYPDGKKVFKPYKGKMNEGR